MISDLYLTACRIKIVDLSRSPKAHSDYCQHFFYLFSFLKNLKNTLILFHSQKQKLHDQFHIYIGIQTDSGFVNRL